MTPIFLVHYFVWHYAKAPALLGRLWMNFLWYLGHMFSTGDLLSSLFAPWRRIVAQSTKRGDLEEIASVVLANIISRLLGAVMRLVLIVMGRLLQLLLLVLGAIFYVIWFILPALLVVTFMYGFHLILNL